MKIRPARLSVACMVVGATLSAAAHGGQPAPPKVADAWKPLPSAEPAGLLGERLKAWREHRLWRVGEDPYLLSGFTSRPGVHEYQGEHLGKWLHAAALAFESTGDPKLLDRMREIVRTLVSAQESNGYLGTYAPADRFYALPTPKQRISWDVWTHRYNLYGLLVYERFHPDAAVVEACARMGDLLRQTFGPARRPITEIGTRHGMSSATVLESIMMLYARTGEGRFLDFAQHLVETGERTAGFRLLGAMLSKEDVSGPGDGKAYQLMGMLLGYLEVYRHTGDDRYLKAAVNGWESIRAGHLHETGGPWSFRSRPIQNAECFAEPRFYQPTNAVETCATTTWIQLCLLLHRLTGQARYGSEAERAVLNHLMGAQAPNGEEWAYFTAPNCARRPYQRAITCCASSGPRALEMYARQLAGAVGDGLSLTGYLPARVPISGGPRAVKSLTVSGNYPFEDRAALRFDLSGPADFAVHFPLPVGVKSISVSIRGTRQRLAPMPSGHRCLRRRWRPGETAEVRLEMPVWSSCHTDSGGGSWVAFLRGPLVLAEGVPEGQPDAPAAIPGIGRAEDPAAGLELVRTGTPLSYRIKGTGEILVPYYLAGSSGGGVRTLFRIPAQRSR